MLNVKHLTCGYGNTPIVTDASFHAKRGEKISVLGANGCGKTTLLRGLAGIIQTSGEVFLDKEDILTMKANKRAKKIALMSQFAPAVFGFTAYETVAMGRYAYADRTVFDDYSNDAQYIKASMDMAGVWTLKDKLMTRLSGGQTQRVFLARAFAQNPVALLLDEPTNHLDLAARKSLTEILGEWAAKDNRVIIGVFHDLSLALTFSDSVLLLKEGHVHLKHPINGLDFNLLNELYGMDVRAYMKGLAKIWL